MIRVKIPVPGYVRKYLEVKYGTEHKVTKTSVLGQIIFMSLSNDIEKPNVTERFTHNYPVNVPPMYVNTRGHSVNRAKLKTIGCILEKIFKEDLELYIDALVASGITINDSITQFMGFYALAEDDIKFETLRRVYDRMKKDSKTCAEKSIKC
nr:hypothetical protein [uncultured Flavobacterium sp.]